MPTTDREERILHAARTLFARRGYSATSMRAIAETAEVSLGLAYNYFGGKEALLHAVVDAGVEQVRASLAALDDSEAPPAVCLQQFVTASLDAVRTHRETWRVLYGLRHHPGALDPRRADIDGLLADIHERLTALFDALGSAQPAADARLLFATIDGAAQHYVRDPDAYPLARVEARIVERFAAPLSA
jgi:AcrR family transcriptional regulator